MLQNQWTTSATCNNNGCVEVFWKKSSKSGTSNCVEVRQDGEDILVRNSTRPDGAFVSYTPAEWDAFIEGAKAGEFDLKD